MITSTSLQVVLLQLSTDFVFNKTHLIAKVVEKQYPMLNTLENEQGCRSKDLKEHLLQKLDHQQGAKSYQISGNGYTDVIFLLVNLLMNFLLLFSSLLIPASHFTLPSIIFCRNEL